jgi:hypothetical protein
LFVQTTKTVTALTPASPFVGGGCECILRPPQARRDRHWPGRTTPNRPFTGVCFRPGPNFRLAGECVCHVAVHQARLDEGFKSALGSPDMGWISVPRLSDCRE